MSIHRRPFYGFASTQSNEEKKKTATIVLIMCVYVGWCRILIPYFVRISFGEFAFQTTIVHDS